MADDLNGQAPKQGYSADYVQSLREEAASWRTKLRDAETNVANLNTQVAQMNHNMTVGAELSKRGLNVDPSWIKIAEGQSIENAIDKFVEAYPQFATNQQPGRQGVKPMPASHKNTNLETQFNPADITLNDIKANPITRDMLRSRYRELLGK